jgi:hypothetical protein
MGWFKPKEPLKNISDDIFHLMEHPGLGSSSRDYFQTLMSMTAGTDRTMLVAVRSALRDTILRNLREEEEMSGEYDSI